ncbi:hypothetical protein ACUHMQ_14970 [Chitinimonas sp. PSY-7]|uniref:hypothetical protein n=1 Tax=Chitinimonas sp. PSY-7 TaxID=3459088 RepID=UPI0040402991
MQVLNTVEIDYVAGGMGSEDLMGSSAAIDGKAMAESEILKALETLRALLMAKRNQQNTQTISRV